MARIDDKVNFTENVSTEHSRPIRLGDTTISRPHICAFFNNRDDEYRVLLPFIKDGLERGEKAVHTVDPARRDEHLGRLAKGWNHGMVWKIDSARMPLLEYREQMIFGFAKTRPLIQSYVLTI